MRQHTPSTAQVRGWEITDASAAGSAEAAEVPSDCDPAMPRTVPFAFEVDVHTAILDGRFIANVPTGELL
jgi:hypothetical protein